MSNPIRDALIEHAKACRAARSTGDSQPAPPRGHNMLGADLSKANLRGANLRGADLRGADLRGTDLRDSDLGGANMLNAILTGADLDGAHLNDTGIMRIRTTYEVTIYPDCRMTYGCETHTLDEWPELVDALAAEHEPARAAEFAAEIRAILALAAVATTRSAMIADRVAP